MIRILVLSTHDANRSQMVAGYLRRYAATPGYAEVYTAGLEASTLSPRAATSMQIDGVNITDQIPHRLSEYQGQTFDYVITVSNEARERLPALGGVGRGGLRADGPPRPIAAEHLHRPFPDVHAQEGTQNADEQVMKAYGEVRDEIKKFVIDFVESYLRPVVQASGASRSGVDTSGVDTSGVETSGVETSGVDTSGVDTSGSGLAGSGYDAP